MPRRRATPRKRPAVRCSWSNRCKRRPSIHVDPGQVYCKTHATIVADILVGNFVKQRDGECQNCHATEDLEWAHVISRGARFIRWHPSNSMALCRACHFRFTQAPAAWAVFVEDRWPGRWTRLIHDEIDGERNGGHVDIAAIIEVYRGVAA